MPANGHPRPPRAAFCVGPIGKARRPGCSWPRRRHGCGHFCGCPSAAARPGAAFSVWAARLSGGSSCCSSCSPGSAWGPRPVSARRAGGQPLGGGPGPGRELSRAPGAEGAAERGRREPFDPALGAVPRRGAESEPRRRGKTRKAAALRRTATSSAQLRRRSRASLEWAGHFASRWPCACRQNYLLPVRRVRPKTLRCQ